LTDVKLIFGDPGWTDYDFSLETRKEAGYEGFLILFRALDEDDFYWVNLGGWGNSQHAIEKEVNGNRDVITPFVRGQIPDKKWIPLKVKVRGNRFECWLDNRLVLDYTDNDLPIPAGAIGLGSWSTSVSYRSIRVTAPDGTTLFSGLPDIPDTRSFPRHWIPSDPDRIIPVTGDALNGEYSIQFDPSGKDLTLTQEHFGIRPGHTVLGSVWLKGRAGAEVRIRIQNSDSTISACRLEVRSSEWSEYDVVLPVRLTNSALQGGEASARGGDQPATSNQQPVTSNLQPATSNQQPATGGRREGVCLEINSLGEVWLDQLSLMPSSALGNNGFRTDLYQAVADIQPTVIRWPGGCYAELYRWKSGIGKQYERQVFPVNIWDDRDVNSLGTDEFITLCRKLGSEPLLVVNSGFHEGAETPADWEPWIREACEWIEYCNGPATSKWGSVRTANGHAEPFGVKFWEIDNELWRSRVPDPHIYSQAVRLFAEAMRKTDPSITVIAHGGNGTDMEWNQVVLDEAADFFDILSIHHYSDPDGYYTAALEQDSLFRKLKKAIAASSNPSVKLYVSEWNAQSTDWRTGLYAANLLNVFEQNSDIVTMAGPALLLRHVTANAWDNAFINFDENGWFPAPNYVVMKLWREHYAPEWLDLKGIPDSVSGVATIDRKNNRLVVKLVNNSSKKRSMSITLPEDFKGVKAQGYLIGPGSLYDRNTMDQPGRIAPRDHQVKFRRNEIFLYLPGLSCLLIEVN
jgi:alpha-N-arabinofuranosidase